MPNAKPRSATAKPAKPVEPTEVAPVPPAPAKAVSRRAAAPKAAAVKVAAKAAGKASAAPADKKPAKARVKLVRDGFTMPETDFALIAQLKQRALGAKREAKKSELLRAGLRVLASLDAKALVAALAQLEAVKTGRPKKAG